MRRKLVVNEPRLVRPTSKQMSVTLRSVFRSSAAARSKQAGEQILVWRLTERAPELAAEVRGRKPRGVGQIPHRERLEVAGVGQVLRPQQMAGQSLHTPEYRLG